MGGTSLFSIHPDILSSPNVHKALVENQTCKYCSHYPATAIQFDCPQRGKSVTKRSSVRRYCFKPITDAELHVRQQAERLVRLASYLEWHRTHPDYNTPEKRAKKRKANHDYYIRCKQKLLEPDG